MRLSLTGRRPAGNPGRFLDIALHVEIHGQASDEVVSRAIALSREKYCSVWNSMRQDVPFDVTFSVNRG
jgi:putative redox protein